MIVASTPIHNPRPPYFRLLGPVEIEAATGRTLAPTRRRERGVLGLLLLELNRSVPVDRLTELLWEGQPPDCARRTVQSHVSRIRALLKTTTRDGTVELTSTGDSYRLSADRATVDVHQFRELVGRAAASTDPAERIADLRTALTLWRGQPLQGAATGWLRDRVCADLEERRLAAIEDLMSTSLALGQGRQILPELTQLAQAYPQRERVVALHMYALDQAGRTGDALAVYRRTWTHLATHLGIEPGPILRRAHEELLQGRGRRRAQWQPAGPPPPSPPAR